MNAIMYQHFPAIDGAGGRGRIKGGQADTRFNLHYPKISFLFPAQAAIDLGVTKLDNRLVFTSSVGNSRLSLILINALVLLPALYFTVVDLANSSERHNILHPRY